MMRVLAVNFEDFQALLFGFYLEKVPAASNSPASSSDNKAKGKMLAQGVTKNTCSVL